MKKYIYMIWAISYSGLSMEFDKIHLKDAIVMWPDMHSFSEFFHWILKIKENSPFEAVEQTRNKKQQSC